MLSLFRCQLRHINHASINILTSILGGRRWHVIWLIRWSPTSYWRNLQLMRCVMWRYGWLLTNRGQLRCINDWIIQWRSHRYHRLCQIISLWVTGLAIKVSVITRSVLWIAVYDCWWTEDSWGVLMTELFNGVETYITSDDNSFLFEWLFLRLKHHLSRGVFCCLPWLFPVPFLWRLPIPFGRGMMNAIWVCGGVLCLLFCLSMAIKSW